MSTFVIIKQLNIADAISSARDCSNNIIVLQTVYRYIINNRIGCSMWSCMILYQLTSRVVYSPDADAASPELGTRRTRLHDGGCHYEVSCARVASGEYEMRGSHDHAIALTIFRTRSARAAVRCFTHCPRFFKSNSIHAAQFRPI